MPERVTEESDLARWQALKRQWEAEKKPGYLVLGNTTYRVLHLVGDKLVFESMKGESLYESTGL